MNFDPSTRAPAMAGCYSLGIPPENRGVVLSERSESKGGGRGAPGLPVGLHKEKLSSRFSTRNRRLAKQLLSGAFRAGDFSVALLLIASGKATADLDYQVSSNGTQGRKRIGYYTKGYNGRTILVGCKEFCLSADPSVISG